MQTFINVRGIVVKVIPVKMSSLKDRLQNPDYINWVKAGLCLIHTKSGLDEFVNTASQSLHQTILTNIVPALASSAQPVCGIAIKRQTLTTICAPPHPYCNGFLTEVLRHGIDPTHKFTVRPGNLANCNVQQWHKQHWEVAKLFMNSGQQSTQTNSYQTDMSGILNFISHCAVPRRKMTNVYLVDGVSPWFHIVYGTIIYFCGDGAGSCNVKSPGPILVFSNRNIQDSINSIVHFILHSNKT